MGMCGSVVYNDSLRAESNAGAITNVLAHICHGLAYRDNNVYAHGVQRAKASV